MVRYLISLIASALLVLALPDLLMAQELPQRPTPTPEAKKSKQADPAREASRSQRSTPTPEARKFKQGNLEPVEIMVEMKIGISDSAAPPNSLVAEESILLSDKSFTNSMSVSEIVSIDDQMATSKQRMKDSADKEKEVNQKSATNQTKKSAQSSDCLPQSGGRSSFGSIGLLTAPLALYIWRRMRKI
jgi:hypothetical protein